MFFPSQLTVQYYTKECLALVEDLEEQIIQVKSIYNEAKKYWKQREFEIREEMKTEPKRYLNEAKTQNKLDLKRAQSVTEDADCLNEDRLIGPKECAFKKPRSLDKKDLDDDVFHPDVNELLDEVKMQQKHIENLTYYINIQREEIKEITLELTSAKMQLGLKDEEIKSLNNKIEKFSDESELRTAYLELEKEMDKKVKGRDLLLEEAKDEVLAGIRMKDDLVEEIEKLEAELSKKEETILTVQSEVEDLKDELSEKSTAYEVLQQQMDDMQSGQEIIGKYEDQLKKAKEEIENLKKEVARLTTTFYRTTPTPNKDLEVKESGKAHLSPGGGLRILNNNEIVMKPSMKCNKDESTISKSAHKIQRRRTTAEVESSVCENDVKENEKPQEQL